MLVSKSTNRKEVLVNVRSADILTLIEGSLQIARNLFIILEEQTSRPPKKPKRNCPSAVFFVGSSHFSRKTSTKGAFIIYLEGGL